MVAGDERCLCRGEGNILIAVGIQAVDAQQPGEPDRQPQNADEIFNVARVLVDRRALGVVLKRRVGGAPERRPTPRHRARVYQRAARHARGQRHVGRRPGLEPTGLFCQVAAG